MKNLIKRILREQLENEEDFSPVIPKFNYAKKYKDIYNYLDNKGLEKRKPKYYDGFVFTYPNEEYPNEDYGILGWRNDGTLFIYYGLINEIFYEFKMNNSDSESIIGKWVSDRFQLEVRKTNYSFTTDGYGLAIDSN